MELKHSSNFRWHKRLFAAIVFRLLRCFWGTDPKKNNGLYWHINALEHINKRYMAAYWPVDYIAKFADQVCRERMQLGIITPADISDTVDILATNVTGIGNIAYVYLKAPHGSQLARKAQAWLETAKHLGRNGYTRAECYYPYAN